MTLQPQVYAITNSQGTKNVAMFTGSTESGVKSDN